MVSLSEIWYTVTGKVRDGVLAVFGDSNQRELNSLQPIVNKINSLEDDLQELDDDQLAAKTDEFRRRINIIYQKVDYGSLSRKKKTEVRQKVFDHFLPESYAVVREAANRKLGQRHFDVQLMGGIALHQGRIAEMATGEGKTLAATLPAYLNALMGDPVHVVTVNDYLAKRDRDLMAPVYEFLGLTVGVVEHASSEQERKTAYKSDITYGTGSTFAFDFLKDNLADSVDEQVQRGHGFAIIDEVDSILIDNAKKPFILSGGEEVPVDGYYQARIAADALTKGRDYKVDKKKNSVVLTESGTKKAEEKLSELKNKKIQLHNPDHAGLEHLVVQSLFAKELQKEGTDYVVRGGEIVIINENTGRYEEGSRLRDGLHQSIEARHDHQRVLVRPETETIAQIAYQNFFGLYDKVSGMTGTAMTSAEEFFNVYGLDSVKIPTNKPLKRIVRPDVVYMTKEEKWAGVVNDIEEKYRAGRPILVGTNSVKDSETLHEMLEKKNIPHNLLNAKNHENEARIVAEAGRKGKITVSTNMAGRGTDIELGGQKPAQDSDDYARWKTEHDEVVSLGGLYVLGTERNNSKRIDNQLAGRGARQGDPGEVRFRISLEDEMIKVQGGEMLKNFAKTIGFENGDVLDGDFVTDKIRTCQRRVENADFETRKNLKKFSDVLESQRAKTYFIRQRVLESTDIKNMAYNALWNGVVYAVKDHTDGSVVDHEKLAEWASSLLEQDFTADALKNEDDVAVFLYYRVRDAYSKKERNLGDLAMNRMEKSAMLDIMDDSWKSHLYNMEELKDGISIRFMVPQQKKPEIEYALDGNQLYLEMQDKINVGFLEHMFSK